MQTYAEKEREKALAMAEYNKRSHELSLLIKPLRTAKYEVDHDWRYLEKALEGYGNDYGGLDLNPDFQRGHVWSNDQQRHYIENVLRGVVSSSGFLVQLNCPNWDMDDHEYKGDLPLGMQCIDGLQRITAIQRFIAGEIRPFGLLHSDLNGSRFSMRGSSYRLRVAIHNFKTRADLLQHYIDLNAGGTPHTQEEIDRVRKLRETAIDQ